MGKRLYNPASRKENFSLKEKVYILACSKCPNKCSYQEKCVDYQEILMHFLEQEGKQLSDKLT